ncbi:MAG: hypothetical protein NVS3B28_22580 [Candidatus Velthaea sp.]
MVCAFVALAALYAVPRTASANVFCPATIGAVENLGVLGRLNTYGLLLDFDPGDTQAVRVRIDSDKTRYAIDFNDIETVGTLPLTVKRYFSLPDGERVSAAWVESTGVSMETRLPCPITQPFDVSEPDPTDRRIIAARQAARRTVRDTFSSKSYVVVPTPFGAVEKRTCPQPFSPPRAILPSQPAYPTEARAARAVGTAIVRVDLDESSSIVNVLVTRSSGFAPLDRAARESALKSTYRTETFACRSIASSYAFVVTFNAP